MIDIAKLTWGEVKENKYDVVVLPWGAIEPHNYHLPYLTDAYLSHSISIESAKLAYKKANKLCMVMPPIYLGSQNPGQWDLPFCIHANYETQKAILTDIVTSLSIQGITKLVIVNGHGGNTFKPYIRDLQVTHPNFQIIVVDWWTVEPHDSYFEEKPDDHAGELETSVVLHYHPELVNMQSAGDGFVKPVKIDSLNNRVGWSPRNWDEVSEDTGVGNPKKSTAEKGKRFAEVVVKK